MDDDKPQVAGSDGIPGDDHRFAPGETVAGRYRIVDLIGAGAIGEVYEAYDEALAEPVALKTLKAQRATDGITVERFRRELLLARKVTHENVCRVYDLGRHVLAGDTVVSFLTMELLRGKSLAQHIREMNRPMSEAEALPLIKQMSAGLEGAHAAGVIHRDFKPGNLVLVPDETGALGGGYRVVITDFGLARRHRLEDEALTHTGEALGTPLYMAPEQVVAGQQPITPATDIYALGIVMYELVTGELPFKGNSITVMALKRVREAPASPRSVRPNLDPRWEAVILRCLEREPARRYQRGPALIAALTGTETPAPTPPSPTPAPPETEGKLRSFIRRATGRYRAR
ncbi:MAG TPA: serine/threonine-protein kinase [Polyangia bacterium]|nr:serine/threonine-protein kinase [Polyangia bacterium]